MPALALSCGRGCGDLGGEAGAEGRARSIRVGPRCGDGAPAQASVAVAFGPASNDWSAR